MKDEFIFGNKTEESVMNFLRKLDQDKEIKIGPLPINNVGFSGDTIIDSLDCSHEIAKKLFKEPTPFKYNEQDEVFIEIDNIDLGGKEKIFLTSDPSNPEFETICSNINENLPEIPYELSGGGYPSKQSELAAIYKIAIANKLQEGEYSEEIEDILKNYDFDKLCSPTGECSFTNLLAKVQKEADSISRVILRCCTTKLVSAKVKKDTTYVGIISEDDSMRLTSLVSQLASINFKYNKAFGKATSQREKVIIGDELYKERKEILESRYVSDELAILFSIHDLDMNAVPGRAKRKIRNSAKEYVKSLIADNSITDENFAIEFQRKLVSRACRQFLRRMKIIRYKLYAKGEREGLLPKF
jgi:hypothetical protein